MSDLAKQKARFLKKIFKGTGTINPTRISAAANIVVNGNYYDPVTKIRDRDYQLVYVGYLNWGSGSNNSTDNTAFRLNTVYAAGNVEQWITLTPADRYTKLVIFRFCTSTVPWNFVGFTVALHTTYTSHFSTDNHLVPPL